MLTSATSSTVHAPAGLHEPLYQPCLVCFLLSCQKPAFVQYMPHVLLSTADLVSFKQIGLPFSQRDVLKLAHDSLSRTTGEHAHIRPFVFKDIFQVGRHGAHKLHGLAGCKAWYFCY